MIIMSNFDATRLELQMAGMFISGDLVSAVASACFRQINAHLGAINA